MVQDYEKAAAPESRIYLLTGPIRSGKTTALSRWIADKKKVGGFLTPDINGRRVLYDIGSRTHVPFEVDDTAVSRNEYIRIGRFHFYRAAFDRGADIITAAMQQPADIVIVDEIGKAELKNSGFAEIVKQLIRAQRSHEFKGDLLFVVRDTLLKKVIIHFDIQSYRLIGANDLPGRP